ncbi:Eukaryotic translation initiation factor 2 subunit 2, partial [Stegodyphus mimosarum]
MTEDETIFDPLLKKKKKKKKMPFDLSALEDNSTNDVGSGEFQPEDYVDHIVVKDENEVLDDREDSVLDLDDFSGLKKKKKKKKPFNLEELESNLPEVETKDESNILITDEKGMDEAALDDDLDFSLPKKKKKKKKINIDELESEFAVADDEDDDDTKFEDDAEPKISTFISSSSWIGTDRDYTYDELLVRVFNIMREKNPDMVAGEKRRFIMRPPQVLRVGTKKTSFANFLEICKMVHRQPRHLQAFLLAELGTSGSVDANNQLIIKGRFQQKQIENVLRRYIKEYVTCHTCRSPDTILQKDTRLFFLQCETCGSRCSVASIKSGFQAVTSKRAAIRAKTA